MSKPKINFQKLKMKNRTAYYMMAWALKESLRSSLNDLCHDDASAEQTMRVIKWLEYLQRMDVHLQYGFGSLETMDAILDAIEKETEMPVSEMLGELTESDD